MTNSPPLGPSSIVCQGDRPPYPSCHIGSRSACFIVSCEHYRGRIPGARPWVWNIARIKAARSALMTVHLLRAAVPVARRPALEQSGWPVAPGPSSRLRTDGRPAVARWSYTRCARGIRPIAWSVLCPRIKATRHETRINVSRSRTGMRTGVSLHETPTFRALLLPVAVEGKEN